MAVIRTAKVATRIMIVRNRKPLGFMARPPLTDVKLTTGHYPEAPGRGQGFRKGSGTERRIRFPTPLRPPPNPFAASADPAREPDRRSPRRADHQIPDRSRSLNP